MNETEAVVYLRQPATIRERSKQLLTFAEAKKLKYFYYDPSKLDAVTQYVVDEIKANYPDLKVPYHSRWSHFNVGGIDRLKEFAQQVSHLDQHEQARARFDLVITSVLLDAGAGMSWRYHEATSNKDFSRSEGLAVASFYAFTSGLFANDGKSLRADAKALTELKPSQLAEVFQVSQENPLVGVEGRAQLLNELGRAVVTNKKFFPGPTPRVGHLYDALREQVQDNRLEAENILAILLEALSTIWPGRIVVDGKNLGDVWRHPALKTNDATSELMPFHKLSQWLSYSLLEPLEGTGITVTSLNTLTGLAEYRNGGLLVDLELLKPTSPDVLTKTYTPDAEAIVEWRALTVALLDKLGEKIRVQLKLSESEFPLVKALQGGTWSAGRKIAQAKRQDGGPPIKIKSDGTVF